MEMLALIKEAVQGWIERIYENALDDRGSFLKDSDTTILSEEDKSLPLDLHNVVDPTYIEDGE